VEKRLKIFPKMETSSRFEKHLKGRRMQHSMKAMERFKIG